MSPPEDIRTLADLARMLHFLKAEGCDQREIAEWLYALTSRLGIRMCYDERRVSHAGGPIDDLPDAPPGGPIDAPPDDPNDGPPDDPKDDRSVHGADEAELADDKAEPEPEPEPEPGAESEPKLGAEPAPDHAKQMTRRGRQRYESVRVTVYRGRLYIGTDPPRSAGPRRRLPPLPASRPGLAGDSEYDNVDETDRFAFLSHGRLMIRRIQLSGGRARDVPRNLQNIPLVSECNGVVIDAVKWSLLAVPPRAFNLRAPTRDVNMHLVDGLYDIIRPVDGTVVTLYAWDNQDDPSGSGSASGDPTWCLATSNGYDVSSLKWLGGKTYAEVFFEIASRYAIPSITLRVDDGGETTRIHFENLDPHRCYTVGFRHHDFHPLRHDPERMWQIQWVEFDPDGSAPVIHFGAGGVPQVPHQTVCDYEILAKELPGDLTVEGLHHLSQNAITNAKALIAGPAPAEDAFHYGYILRSRDPEITKSCSDILVESPLLTFIRTKVYQQPRSRAMREDLDHDTRLEYNVLRAYLTTSDRADFPSLLPQYADDFRRYGEFIQSVKDNTIRMLRQRALSNRVPKSRTPTMTVAAAMQAHIERNEPGFNAFHKNTKAVVHDYVVRPEYTHLFLTAIRAGRRAKKPVDG